MISVVIPAFNEVHIIAETVQGARSIPGVKQVIVVDDGSTDGTAQAAAAAGSEVISLAANQGKGQALARGMAKSRGDIVLFLDADLGKSAVHAQKLVECLIQCKADMVVACFPPGPGGGGFGITLNLARWGTWLLTKKKMQAPLSGQRAFSHRALAAIGPPLPGFGTEVGFNVRAARRGMIIMEATVPLQHRVTGRNWRGFYHRARQFWHILGAFLLLLREG